MFDLPVALGFGIKTPDQLEQFGDLIDAAVFGSALIDPSPRRRRFRDVYGPLGLTPRRGTARMTRASRPWLVGTPVW